MAVFREEIHLSTKGNKDMNNITYQVESIIARSDITEGICHVFNVGSTGVIATIEFEEGLAKDFPDMLYKLIAPSRDYGHEQAWHDGNGHSHLQASLVGPEITVPVDNGKLLTGTWQQIFHYEADIKPRQRTIIVTVIGD